MRNNDPYYYFRIVRTVYACITEAAAMESRLWALLVALNSPHFDLRGCNFTERNMRATDKRGESKEGSGRVRGPRSIVSFFHSPLPESKISCLSHSSQYFEIAKNKEQILNIHRARLKNVSKNPNDSE